MFGSDDNFVIAAVGDRFNPNALDEVRGALCLSCRADFPQMLRGGNIDPDIARHLPDAGYLLANFVRDTADVQTLEALLGVPQASPLFRQVLRTHRMDQLNLADGSEAERARLARIMVKILGELGEQASPLQWVVAQPTCETSYSMPRHTLASRRPRCLPDSRERQAMDSLLRTPPFSDDLRLLVSEWARGE